jgi:hypothetical protein
VDVEYGEYVEPELPSYEGIPVSEAEDGVYAVLANGTVIDYTLVNRSQAIGVALVLDGQGLMLADYDGDDGESLRFRWGESGVNLDMVDYTIAYGSDSGRYPPSSITDWPTSNEDAMNDFDGKENTEILQSSNGTASRYNIAYLVANFNEGNTSAVEGDNHGFNDWYIPTLGQLVLLYMYKDEIKNAYDSIGGGSFLSPYERYWSSTECDANKAWTVDVSDDGYIESKEKPNENKVRFIRDLI